MPARIYNISKSDRRLCQDDVMNPAMNAGNPIGYCSICSDSARLSGGFSVLSLLNDDAGMSLNGEPNRHVVAKVNAGVAITVPPIKRRRDNHRLLPNGARPNIDAGWQNKGDKPRKAISNRVSSLDTSKVISNRSSKDTNSQDLSQRGIRQPIIA